MPASARSSIASSCLRSNVPCSPVPCTSTSPTLGFTLGPVTGDTRRVVCFSTLDNLVKGGAGQAIQSFNVMMGWDERLTLAEPGLWP